MTVTHKLFKILSGHRFCIKCYCDLDLWPSKLKMHRGNHDQFSYQVEWLSLKNVSRYWATWFLHKMLLWTWPSISDSCNLGISSLIPKRVRPCARSTNTSSEFSKLFCSRTTANDRERSLIGELWLAKLSNVCGRSRTQMLTERTEGFCLADHVIPYYHTEGQNMRGFLTDTLIFITNCKSKNLKNILYSQKHISYNS